MRILRRFMLLSVLIAIASIVVSGCSSAPVAPAASKGEPEWITKGSGAFDTPKGKIFLVWVRHRGLRIAHSSYLLPITGQGQRLLKLWRLM